MTGKFSSILSVSQAYQIELNKDRYTKKRKTTIKTLHADRQFFDNKRILVWLNIDQKGTQAVHQSD